MRRQKRACPKRLIKRVTFLLLNLSTTFPHKGAPIKDPAVKADIAKPTSGGEKPISVAKMEKRTEVKAKIKLEAKAMLKNIKKFVEPLFFDQLCNILNYSQPRSRLFFERKKEKEEERQSFLKRKSQRSQSPELLDYPVERNKEDAENVQKPRIDP
jgi:hypothetical protein